MIVISGIVGTQVIQYGPSTTPDFTGQTPPPPPPGPQYDVGSSISGGTFTDSGWKPASVKWSRQRHDAFLEAVREEARRSLAEERQLTAIGRAERDMKVAEEKCATCDAEFNRNATRANHTAQTEARERLETARTKVNEMHSIEYIEKLWADYHAKRDRGRH